MFFVYHLLYRSEIGLNVQIKIDKRSIITKTFLKIVKFSSVSEFFYTEYINIIFFGLHNQTLEIWNKITWTSSISLMHFKSFLYIAYVLQSPHWYLKVPQNFPVRINNFHKKNFKMFIFIINVQWLSFCNFIERVIVSSERMKVW